eukprot:2392727-Pyramimonas_sp.AAC.1
MALTSPEEDSRGPPKAQQRFQETAQRCRNAKHDVPERRPKTPERTSKRPVAHNPGAVAPGPSTIPPAHPHIHPAYPLPLGIL